MPKQRLLALATESEPHAAPLVVDEHLIRHWCETLEDGNPLYLDEAFARSQGHQGLVAPPGSVMTDVHNALSLALAAHRRPAARHIHYDVKEALDLPVGIITEVELETLAPLVVGDRVSLSQRLVSVSPWKRTRLGEGHFWTMERLYRNQRGELVARERLTAFGYGREQSRSDEQAIVRRLEPRRRGSDPRRSDRLSAARSSSIATGRM